MIRIIVKSNDPGMAINIGGPIIETFRTFDVDAPDLEYYLHHPVGTYETRQIIGVEWQSSRKEEPK